jgi:NADH-quinone oxidoreductase subunit D
MTAAVMTNPTTVERVAGKSDEMLINLGPQHPATHGVLKVVLGVDGERVTRAVPHIGFLHRNHEKLEEVRTYEQCIPYTDRMDYVSGMQNELPLCLAVEEMLGVEVPERGKYVRTILFELSRIASHLVWIGTYMLDLGAITPFLYAFRDRELILDIIERTAGARLLPNYYSFGGVRRDHHPRMLQDISEFLDFFELKLPEYEALTLDAPVFQARTVGVGVLDPQVALNHGVTGPNLRGSGIPWDLRKSDPYDAYPYVDFEIMVEHGCDAYARSRARFREFRQSIFILRQLLAQCPKTGPVKGKVPRIKPPMGAERYRAAEISRGHLGVYIVSDGTEKPWRSKHRSPSFCTLQVLEDLFVGSKFSDAIAILGSVDIVLGEVDR